MARIALVHDVAGVAANQAKLLRDAGYEVDQIPLWTPGGNWDWPQKALLVPFRALAYIPLILKLRRGKYDVVHIHWLLHGLVGQFIGQPFFVQAHGTDLHENLRHPVLRWATRRVLKSAAIVFYVTPNLLSFLEGFEDKARLLPNPIDVDSVPIAPPPAEVSDVLIFTRLDPVKGVDEIFKAVERLSQIVRLQAVEWGPVAREYTRRYKAWVRFTRPLPRAQIEAYLQSFDLVIGQMKQGILGLSEIEALAAGRPLVTGVDNTLYREDPPPLLAVGNAEDIVAAITGVQRDSAELARLSVTGREWARRNHGFARHLELLESSYFGERTSSTITPTAR